MWIGTQLYVEYTVEVVFRNSVGKNIFTGLAMRLRNDDIVMTDSKTTNLIHIRQKHLI